jgi:hypothetical protein
VLSATANSRFWSDWRRADSAWSDGQSWTVVEYKTDRRESRNIAQVQLYAFALQRATGLPVRAILLEV